MENYESIVRILFRKIVLLTIVVCILASIYLVIWDRQYDRIALNIVMIGFAMCAYAITQYGKMIVAYHFTMVGTIAILSAFIVSTGVYFNSLIMMGTTLSIFTLMFYSDRRIQWFYIGVILLFEFFLFHHTMGEQGFNLSDQFFPEYLSGVFHILVIYLVGYYFMEHIRKSNEEIDIAKKSIVAQDESLRKQEESLQKYIESNSNLEIFTSLASHELKSPMRIIKSFVDLIVKRRKDLSEDQIEDYLNMISTNSEKMSNLVDALYEMGSVSQMELNKLPIGLPSFVDSIITEETQVYPNSEVSVDYDTDKVYGDSDLLRRLFSNLVSNALKFSSTGSGAIVQIHCFERRGYFCFKICDNGIGITEDKRNEVFELFNRQTNYSEYKGLGIGLALSKKIVDMHAGTIHILDSDIGGVCFEVRLPLF